MNFGLCGGRPPKVVKCSCKHEHQDKVYGVGMRLANRCKPNDKAGTYRCTVCKKEHS